MDPVFPSLTQLYRRDTLEGVFEDVGAEEILKKFFTDERLHECQELEPFFVGHRGEHVVWGVALKDWVKA